MIGRLFVRLLRAADECDDPYFGCGFDDAFEIPPAVWFLLAVPVIAVVVWVIALVMHAAEKDRRGRGPSDLSPHP